MGQLQRGWMSQTSTLRMEMREDFLLWDFVNRFKCCKQIEWPNLKVHDVSSVSKFAVNY